MRQRFAAAIGAFVTIGLFLLTCAKRAAETIEIIHLPRDVEELLPGESENLRCSGGELSGSPPGCRAMLLQSIARRVRGSATMAKQGQTKNFFADVADFFVTRPIEQLPADDGGVAGVKKPRRLVGHRGD
jgi:hypothetical protein